jgi:hypothetical protein
MYKSQEPKKNLEIYLNKKKEIQFLLGNVIISLKHSLVNVTLGNEQKII